MFTPSSSIHLLRRIGSAPQRATAAILLLTFFHTATFGQDIELAPQPSLPIVQVAPGQLVEPAPPLYDFTVKPCNDPAYCTDEFTIAPADGWEARVITAWNAPHEYQQFAGSAISLYMAKKNLKPGSSSNDGSDSGYKRFVISRRNEARAAVFLALLNAIYTPAYQRTPQEKIVVDFVTQQIKTKRITAAAYALEQYHIWKQDPCRYTAPSPFTYKRPTCKDSSSGTLGDLFDFGYEPPPVADYGVAYSYPELTVPQAVNAVSGIATQAKAMAASIGGGTAIGLAFPRITPTLAVKVSNYLLPYEMDDIYDLKTIRLSFLRFAGPIGTMMSTLVDLIMVGIDVVEREKYESKLIKALDNAQTRPIDLSVEVQNDKGMSELLGVYGLSTLFNGPDPANIYSAPALNALKLKVTSSIGGNGELVPMVTYRTWDNSLWSASVSPNGFFTHAKVGAAFGHTDTLINYKDWNGFSCSATYDHSLRMFRYSVSGGPTQISQTLQMQGDGRMIVMSVPAQPAPDYSMYVTQRSSGSPIATQLLTDKVPYVTKWGNRWTAKRIGLSTWEHTPEGGGTSRVSSKIDLILMQWQGANYYYCVTNKQFDVELFCGITPLFARPTTEALRGIYGGSGKRRGAR